MGQGVIDDLERIKQKGKTLYEIPRVYKDNDESARQNTGFYKEISKNYKTSLEEIDRIKQ